MNAAGGSMLESPVTMAHEQLTSQLTYEGPYSIPAGLDMAAMAAAAPQRHPSKGHQGRIVKRAASSPNVRSLSAASDPSLSLADKRRNKLGYHRTSVACVHCRRRKIRCLLAPEDPQNRCANCIRLKKECNFFPVDQQPSTDRRPRTGSKMDVKSGGGSVSSSSSPNVVGSSRPGEQSDSFAQFQHLPHAATFPSGMVAAGPSRMSPQGSAGEQQRIQSSVRAGQLTDIAAQSSRFDFQDQPSGAGWDMRFFESQHIPTNHPAGSGGGDEHGHQNFWKVPETPITPSSFSPYSSAPQSAVLGSNGPYGHGWPHPPIRSMSYGQIDEHTHHGRQDSHSSASIAYGSGDLRRSTIDMPPPALGAHSGSTTSTSAASLGADGAHGQVGYANVHTWNMLPTQSPKGAEFSGGNWFSDPSQLAKVHEDEVSHFGTGMHGSMYTGR